MKLDKLPRTTTRKKKRVGRGYGSGKGGHTAGRGNKGQGARSKVKPWFEGGQSNIIRRMAMQRGKGKFKKRPGPLVLNLDFLNLLPAGTKVNLETLIKHGLIDEKAGLKSNVKILGGGELKKELTVALVCSQGAAEKIKKAGGKVLK